jgi:serine/threonine protein kinase/Tol biopolymer transport system component
MGEVYLAQDMTLGRVVALKILPAEIGSDQQRMQRFVQEARTASALNHPNILTIHEIGQVDSTHFIATEFIDGQTLRQQTASHRLKLSEALDIAIQIATALAAAHAAGIVHRDLKPENIMLRSDGYVKVLDFGLAKSSEHASSAVDPEAATQMLVNTSPGMVMGTVSYMSPEQARGLPVDARTDIWSLGCVLYEMVTGHTPFAGETTSDVIVSVLDREPPPLTAEAPPELHRILRKALRKDREERYQTVRDLLVDLKDLKQEIDFEAKLEISVPPESRAHLGLRTSGGLGVLQAGEETAAHTGVVAAARRTLGSGQTAASIKTTEGRKHLAILAVFAVLVAGASVMLYLYLQNRSRQKPGFSFDSMKITRVTTSGKSVGATISADGKYIAHILNDAGQQSLWVRQVATSRTLQIVPPAEVHYLGITFSPDGNYIYYVIGKMNEPMGELYQIPVLGGAPKKLVTDIDSPVTFSPDGKRFAFIRGDTPKAEVALLTANADGTGEKRLAARKAPRTYGLPAWSPDGKHIACVAGETIAGKVMSVVEVNAEDGTERPVTTETWIGVGQLAWLGDGSGMLMLAVDRESRLTQLWHLSYPEGVARRMTNDLNNYAGISVAPQSGDIVTIRYDQSSNIWVAPVRAGGPQARGGGARESLAVDTSQAAQVTSGAAKYYGGAWTPDGKVVYSSDASGRRDLWIMDRDGSNQRQLTADAGGNFSPAVSPDGRYIVFVSDRASGKHNLWRIDADGANPKQLTSGDFDRSPTFSPDGKWIVYSSFATRSPTLWRLPAEGGDVQQVTDKFSTSPVVSPDGKLIACYYWDELLDSQLGIAIVPFEGGRPVKTFILPAGFVRWTPDGRALTYVDSRSGVSNIWSQPIEGGPPKQLTDFKADLIFGFDWSRDGRQLGCTRGILTSDVILFSDAK